MEFQTFKNVLLLCLILLENFLFSGVLYGWVDFLKLLKRNELFIHQCKVTKGENACIIQETMFFLLYTVCSLAKALSGVFTLQLLKTLSLKYVRMFPLFFIITGGMLLAYTTEIYPKMVYFGAVMLSMAGGQVLFCSFSVATLFPNRRCIVISLCCGAFCASHAIFYFFQEIEDRFGLTYRQIFTIWSSSAVIMLLPNIFLLKELQPTSKRTYATNVAQIFAKTKRSKNKKYQLLEDTGSNSDESDAENKISTTLEPNIVQVDIENRFDGWRANTFIASIPFFFHVWWSSVLLLVLLTYSKDFDTWRESQQENNTEDWITKIIWKYSPFAMFLIAPISGVLLDFSMRNVTRENDLDKLKMKRARSGSWVVLLTTFMVVVLLILKIMSNPTVTSAGIYIVAYATCTTVSIAYMSIRFPWEVFRNLLSVLWLVSTTFDFLVFPLQMLQSIYPSWPTVFLMGLMTTSIVNIALPYLPPVFRSFDSISVIST